MLMYLAAFTFVSTNDVKTNILKYGLPAYLTTASERILFSSVIMVLAFGARRLWFDSCPDLIFLPCIFSFVSSVTEFVRKMGARPGLAKEPLNLFNAIKGLYV